MRLKSYFAATVEAAMALARQELGEDALLVHSRPATAAARYRGAYEAVFATPAQAGLKGPEERAAAPAADCLGQDVTASRREIQRVSRLLAAPRLFATPSNPAPEFDRRLASAELDVEIAQDVAGGAALEKFFTVDATLVKLAARYGLTRRRPMQILSADAHRIAAAEQLRTLAAILGVGLDVLETPAALAQALEAHRNKELILIATPGLAFRAALPASLKAADLARGADSYAMFEPKKLLFTRLDETSAFGPLVSESGRRQLLISFLAAGQQIPENLQPATAARVVMSAEVAPVHSAKGATA